jgi:hypothetical protein
LLSQLPSYKLSGPPEECTEAVLPPTKPILRLDLRPPVCLSDIVSNYYGSSILINFSLPYAFYAVGDDEIKCCLFKVLSLVFILAAAGFFQYLS